MIDYKFKLDDGSEVTFVIDPDRRAPLVDEDTAPGWADLAYQKCTNCPLDEASHRKCPAAVDASDVVMQFSRMLSFESADVTVTAPERSYFKRCDLQTALRSVLGLIMATSGCPHLAKLRPMAKYHLPFATKEETVFRTASVHLLRQYFVHKQGGQPDLDLTELRQLYRELREVNRCFTERIRAGAERDANLNAILVLASLSVLVSYTLEDGLAQYRALFSD